MVYIKFIYIGKCYNRPFNSDSNANVWNVNDNGNVNNDNVDNENGVHPLEFLQIVDEFITKVMVKRFLKKQVFS